MDYLTAIAASRLAVRIQLYWATKGLHGVQVWAEPISLGEVVDGERTIVYQVRSNIVEKLRKHVDSYSHAIF